MSNDCNGIKFGEGIKRLEEIVEKMEKEEFELEEMLERFQEGMNLYKILQKKLQDVEVKITEVLEQENAPGPVET
ncbi:MAG: exodeoxyribonuclease VII small subunit [Candidatus Wallbacteria bacterium]|nr:exodeoxyribonuclease VII small subunit [Candidatus Wallbacteria bacterium]